MYPVGVPVTFFGFMYKHRHVLDWPTTKMQLGFLYDAYTLDAWWFEMVS